MSLTGRLRRGAPESRHSPPTVSRVSARTVWEEGRVSGSRVTRLAVIAATLVTAVSLLATGGLGAGFDIAFGLICVWAAFAVRPRDFFRVGVLAPLLLLAVMAVVAVVYRVGIASARDGIVQSVVSGLAHHSGALFASCVGALVVLAIRRRVLANRADQRIRARSPYNVRAHSKREASPAPYLITSGAPEEKSTIVVDSELASPESRTASSF